VADVTFTARWEKKPSPLTPTPTPDDPTPTPTPDDPTPVVTTPTLVDEVTGEPEVSAKARVYSGLLLGTDGSVVGSVQVSAAKAKLNKKTGLTTSKLTITIQPADETKKVSIKGDYDVNGGTQTFAAKGREISLLLGANGLSGSFEGAKVTGVPDTNDPTSYVGAYNIVADEGTFSVTVDKKGKAKVSGTTAAGKNVSATSQLAVGKDVACVAVVVPKLSLSFVLWLGEKCSVEGLTNAAAGLAGTLSAGAVFQLDAAAFADALAAGLGGERVAAGRDLAEFLPDCSVEQGGKKWIVAGGAKAGKVALTKDGTIDETKLGDNPSALKLTYTEKSASFKGSFKAYTLVKGKLKATSATVTGVMIDGVGYGTATVKKPALSYDVVIGPVK